MNRRPIERDITEPFTIDGKTYDLSGLARIHKAWTPVMWTTEELYRIGDAEFLSVCRSPPLHGPGKARIHLNSRPGAIDAAIKMNAPDDVIERLGTDLFLDTATPEMAKKHLLCPGAYYQDWSKTLSQRAERALNLLEVQL